MSFRPHAAPVRHSLRDVLAAGLATEMPKRDISEMEAQQEGGDEEQEAQQEFETDSYAVTVAIVKPYQRPQEPLRNERWSDRPFIIPADNLPMAPVIMYRRFPRGGFATLDEICSEMAKVMIQKKDIYATLYDRLKNELSGDTELPMHRESILADSFNFKALLCMHNALTSCDYKPQPFLAYEKCSGHSENDSFEMYTELDNLVEGLTKGVWEADLPPLAPVDVERYVQKMAFDIDPRDEPCMLQATQPLEYYIGRRL